MLHDQLIGKAHMWQPYDLCLTEALVPLKRLKAALDLVLLNLLTVYDSSIYIRYISIGFED